MWALGMVTVGHLLETVALVSDRAGPGAPIKSVLSVSGRGGARPIRGHLSLQDHCWCRQGGRLWGEGHPPRVPLQDRDACEGVHCRIDGAWDSGILLGVGVVGE